MRKTIYVIGIFCGIFSVVSFFERLFEVGLFGIANDVIEYYRTVAYFILGWPARLFNLHFPEPLMDMWALSFVGAAAYCRTKNIDRSRFFRRNPKLIMNGYWRGTLLLVFGLSGMGIIVLLNAISPTTYVDEFHDGPLDLSKGAGKQVLFIIASAIAFFILNAFAPSI